MPILPPALTGENHFFFSCVDDCIEDNYGNL